MKNREGANSSKRHAQRLDVPTPMITTSQIPELVDNYSSSYKQPTKTTNPLRTDAISWILGYWSERCGAFRIIQTCTPPPLFWEKLNPTKFNLEDGR